MDKKEAFELRNKYEPIVVGKPFPNDDGSSTGEKIVEIVVSRQDEMTKVYMKMLENDMGNEEALLYFSQNDLDVFVVSEFSWSSSILLHLTLKEYLKRTNQH